LIELAIKQLVAEKQLVRLGKMIAVASDETRLSKKQRALIDKIISLYQGTRTPPTLKELAGQTDTTIDSVSSLVRFLGQQDLLIDLGHGFWISSDVFRALCGELRDLLETGPERSVAEIRDHWGLTRKYVIPLLEYCDRMQVTARAGDVRTAGSRIIDFLPEQCVEQD
jgi:selenocysteine-specific elongation factor